MYIMRRMGGKSRRGPDRLKEYREKRSADRTPEPFPGESAQKPGLFVVHKHAASRLHFDLRLEMGGVLESWAVPKGPSLDPDVKRLAMKVEDHPLEYAEFEGVIPQGNYGAGAIIIWDRGVWVSIGDPEEGLEKGKLLFDLRGYKLRGRWTLFRTKRSQTEWLLVKKPDAHADTGDSPPQESIVSNLTVEQLRDGHDPAEAIRSRCRRLKAPLGKVPVSSIGPMLAQTADEPFTRKGWVFALKYDGYRLLAARRDGRPVLRYRRGQDVTARFPEIAGALASLPYESIVLDGEVVVLDEEGLPSFQRLQQRVHLTRRHDIQRASVRLAATLFVFDLLGFEEYDVRPLKLIDRKRLLASILPAAGPLRYSDHIETRGEEMFEQVRRMRLEGIIAKRADSPYRAGRSEDWLKIKADRTGDFVIVGYSRGKGGRSGLGSLHLGVYDGGALVYAGRVGTGFDDKTLAGLKALLDPAMREDPPCEGATPAGEDHVWVDPALVCEVRYKEWTQAGSLRHPVYLRLRDDKSPAECVRERAARGDPGPGEVVSTPSDEAPVFTNLDKVFWPEEGYTKGDLIDFYREVAPWLLPYLKDRPVVLTRYPDGIAGKSFFQKDAPGFVPDWVRTETMWSEHAEREIHYFICDDERTLLYLANMGTIPLHVWSSRLATLQLPDWSILDLDPKKAPFRHVVRVALAIRALCEEIGLDCYVKTSGSSGLHVLVPMGAVHTYEASRMLAHLLARIVSTQLPDIATIARSVASRGERVYIDYLQNGHGKLLVSPFCVRPLPGATVSTTLLWSEVNHRLDISKFTIRTVPRRLKRMDEEPMLPVMSGKPDLAAVLERLERKLR